MIALAGLQGREDEQFTLRRVEAETCPWVCDPAPPQNSFLDEPTSGVDPKARRLFWDIIYNLAADGTTVMVTTHFMDEAEHCDKVAFIYFGGLIADDTPVDLKKLIPGKLYEVESENGFELLASIQRGEAGTVMDSYFWQETVCLLLKASA